MKELPTGGPYEKPGKAPAASLTLLDTVRLSVHREEDTGMWVNSGSKCRRSVGPLCETKQEEQELDMFIVKHYNIEVTDCAKMPLPYNDIIMKDHELKLV